MIICVHCGKVIKDDSSFCPYCGKKTETQEKLFCCNCGKQLIPDSAFCPYCGQSVRSRKKNNSSTKAPQKTISDIRFPKIKVKSFGGDRFCKLYVVWFLVQCILCIRAQFAYTDYFNDSHLSPNCLWGKGGTIYPEHWLYPFSNIFKGINGQDPVYMYDFTEFLLYVIVCPLLVYILLKIIPKWFRVQKEKTLSLINDIVFCLSLWVTVVLVSGMLGLVGFVLSLIGGGLIIIALVCSRIE